MPLSEIQGGVFRLLASRRDPEIMQEGVVVQPDPDRLIDYQTHAGQRRGQWPSSPEITTAMFERYTESR